MTLVVGDEFFSPVTLVLGASFIQVSAIMCVSLGWAYHTGDIANSGTRDLFKDEDAWLDGSS